MALKKIVSFGFRQGEPAPRRGAIIIDVRRLFWNPHLDKTLQPKRGTDPEVGAVIAEKTSDFEKKLAWVKAQALQEPDTEVVYLGCYGGQHRSVFLANLLGGVLNVPVEHRDLA